MAKFLKINDVDNKAHHIKDANDQGYVTACGLTIYKHQTGQIILLDEVPAAEFCKKCHDNLAASLGVV